MKRIGLSVLILALALGGTLVGAVLFRRERGSQLVQPVSLAKRQPAPAPVSPPPRAIGAIMIGNGSGFTVIRSEPQRENLSYLNISLSGKGELLLQDNQSRATGFDVKSGALLNQIENSSYDEGDQIDDDDEPPSDAAAPEPNPEPKALSGLADNDFRRLEISQPAPGIYLLTVLADAGTSNQKYSLQVSFSNPLRDPSFAEFKDVAALPGSVHNYRLRIPSEAQEDIKLERIQP